jgi:hypothetical protein
VAVAGILEPAYRAAGDSFDYALNDSILHLAVIDAMGHDLDASAMATIAIGAFRARQALPSAFVRFRVRRRGEGGELDVGVHGDGWPVADVLRLGRQRPNRRRA